MLTNATVKAARAGARPFKLFDSGGLYLFVRPSGTKTWRVKRRHGGREQLLTLGTWPELDLAGARERRDEARAGEGSPHSQAGASSGKPITFEQLARAWFEQRRDRWSAVHAADVLASLERDVFPAIGATALPTIGAATLLDVLQAVEARGCIETARRLHERISAVFRFGIPRGHCMGDPAAAIADELRPRPASRSQPALSSIDEARSLMQAVDHLGRPAPDLVHLASRLLALTAVRSRTLRFAEVSEFEDLSGREPVWRVPPAKLKLKKTRKADPAAELVIPLSRQAAALARQLVDQATGSLLFPGRKSARPIGENALRALYAAAGYGGRHVPHGWRATFSTVMNGQRPDDRTLIDQALGHVGLGKVEAAYNRAAHLERRRDLFQRWADLLLGCGPHTEV